MEKKIRPRLLFSFSLLLLICTGGWAAPQAETLLRSALEPPTHAYRGHMTVTQWSDKGTRSEEFGILFIPPNRYRLEFYRPDGQINRVVWSDGDQEKLEFPNAKKVYSGKASKISDKLMDPDDEWNLLLKNYTLGQESPASVVGRAAWKLELSPKMEGKPNEIIWVDKQNNMILKVKRFIPNSNLAVLSEYTHLELHPNIDPKIFGNAAPDQRQVAHHGLDPDFMSYEDMDENNSSKSRPPQTLQKGFVFESGDFFTVRGDVIHHFRYTDGLTVVSLFQTPRPVRLQPDSMVEDTVLQTQTGAFHATGPTHIVHWKNQGVHYTLIGDLPKDVLKEISASLK